MTRQSLIWLLGWAASSAAPAAIAAEGDASLGAQAFARCVACHSLDPGRHLTGPSLAGVVGRAAARAPGFRRYSDALAASGLTWDRQTLDRWLADPSALVPGTSMRVEGIADPETRRDLIAFLEAVGEGSGAGGHTAMIGARQDHRMLNLKQPTPSQRVTAIRHCDDAYYVTLGTGKTYTFWEFNLRFKTDSSPDGPRAGAPAIVRAGMRGDRAQVVFAGPDEISAFIRSECPVG